MAYHYYRITTRKRTSFCSRCRWNSRR